MSVRYVYVSLRGKQRSLEEPANGPPPKVGHEKPARKTLVISIRVEALDEGGYLAFCDSIQGCHAEGDTVAEALENIEDVAKVLLEVQKEHGISFAGEVEEYQKGRTLAAELLVPLPE